MTDRDEINRELAENWKSIQGFKGYEISDHGRVRSYRAKNGPQIMRTGCSNNQYPGVRIQNSKGESKFIHVHRLVLKHFGPPKKKGQICLHNDGSRTNNHISNLRWGTHAENMHDKWRHGTMPIGSRTNSAKLNERDAEVIKYLLGRQSRPSDIQKVFGIDLSTVMRIQRGETWKHV